jgi:hypothetical protein
MVHAGNFGRREKGERRKDLLRKRRNTQGKLT